MSPDDLRCLSVRQPWASLIASGDKTVELRTWRTTHRGPVLLCSSLARGHRELCARYGVDAMSYGVSLALIEVEDVRLATRADATAACWELTDGDFAWLVRVVRSVRRVPVSGRLGFWRPDGAWLARVLAG